MMRTCLLILAAVGTCAGGARTEETLAPLRDGKVPQTFEELWSGFDPCREPLDVEVLHEWEQDGVIMKVIRYRVGIFKGKKAMMAAVYGYPKGAKKVPGLVQIHGGGGSGTEGPVLANAKEGYATISIAWDGRIRAAKYPIDNEAKQLFWEGKKDHPKYRPTTDWGDLAGFFHPRRYQNQKAPEHQLDPVDSPRNSHWFLCHHALAIEGDSKWQRVVLSPSDFKQRGGEAPKDWEDLDIVISLPHGWTWQDVKMRNLAWIENDKLGDRVR